MHQNENDAQIGNIQIGNDRIGRLEMLRLAEWNGPSRPPYIWPCYTSVDWSRSQTVFLASAGKCGLEMRLVSRSMRLFASWKF